MRFLPDIFKKKLSVQIFIAFAVLVFTMSTAFVVLSYNVQKHNLISELEKSGTLLVKTLRYTCKLGVYTENTELLHGPVAAAFQHEGALSVDIYTPKKILFYHMISPAVSEHSEHPKSDSLPPSFLEEALSTTPSVSVQILDKEDRMEFWSTIRSTGDFSTFSTQFEKELALSDQNDLLGFICIGLSKAGMQNQLSLLFMRNLAMAALFLIVGLFTTFLIARQITQPLKRLTQAAITSGTAGVFHKLPVESPNEIGELAAAFNELSTALDKRDLEKQLLEEKLWQAQKMEAIGTLAGGIAHDFNNIIGIISGFSEIALTAAPPDTSTRFKDCIKEVFNAAGRAKDLVNQILTFSRKGAIIRKPLQISLVIKEALKMLRASLPSTIELKQNIPNDLPPVIADPTQIYQILMNLCTNAGHALRDNGGILEVSLGLIHFGPGEILPHPDLSEGAYQKLTVRDTGHGMTREVIERIFEPFYTTKGPGEGTGMGLSVVHGIVKGHEGVILVQSEPGKGTSFDIFLPSMASDLEPEIFQDTRPESGIEHILLVDDEASLTDLGVQMLSSYGYHVSTAANGLDALAVFKKDPEDFDLVITDMTMPKMTGLDLSHNIRQLREDIPIILCTGYTETVRMETAKAIGIRKLVNKPILWNELAGVIRKIIDSPIENG
jgi:signal transduction histidine kinase